MTERAEHTAGPWTMKGPDPFGYYTIHEPTARLAIGVVVSNLRPPNVVEANARLITAAPDLLHCQTMGASKNTPDFLDWIADRLIHVYSESENVDFVLSLRDRAQAGRAAIYRATGEA